LRDCLAAVLAQETRGSREILAIDSGSTDGSAEFLKQQPVRLLQIPNGEFGHGSTRNLGVRESDSDFIVLLSQDAVPCGTNWLESLLRPFGNAKCGGVYGRQLPRNTHACERHFLEKTYPEAPAVRRASGNAPLTLRDMFFSNVNSACRRELLLRWPFREDLVMSEDQQWAKDALLGGFELHYVPDACVFHSHRYTVKQVFRRYFDSGASLRLISNGKIGDTPAAIFRYLYEEILLALNEEGVGALPHVIAYELARFFGYRAGNCEPWLPLWAKRFLSANRTYW